MVEAELFTMLVYFGFKTVNNTTPHGNRGWRSSKCWAKVVHALCRQTINRL